MEKFRERKRNLHMVFYQLKEGLQWDDGLKLDNRNSLSVPTNALIIYEAISAHIAGTYGEISEFPMTIGFY